MVVEPLGGRVERGQVCVAACERTVVSPLFGEGGIDVGIVVDASSEESTTSHTNSVGAREGSHLIGVEAFGIEHRDERRKVGAWPREVVISVTLARRPRILPTE